MVARSPTNALRHGLYSPRLPDLAYPEKQANRFRQDLEDEVLANRGKTTMSVADAALIHRATEAQRLAYKNRYDAREAKAAGKLTPELTLEFDREYQKHLDTRDRAIRALKLGHLNGAGDPGDMYAGFRAAAAEAERERQAAQDAAENDDSPGNTPQEPPTLPMRQTPFWGILGFLPNRPSTARGTFALASRTLSAEGFFHEMARLSLSSCAVQVFPGSS